MIIAPPHFHEVEGVNSIWNLILKVLKSARHQQYSDYDTRKSTSKRERLNPQGAAVVAGGVLDTMKI